MAAKPLGVGIPQGIIQPSQKSDGTRRKQHREEKRIGKQGEKELWNADHYQHHKQIEERHHPAETGRNHLAPKIGRRHALGGQKGAADIRPPAAGGHGK